GTLCRGPVSTGDGPPRHGRMATLRMRKQCPVRSSPPQSHSPSPWRLHTHSDQRIHPRRKLRLPRRRRPIPLATAFPISSCCPNRLSQYIDRLLSKTCESTSPAGIGENTK